ncbi:caffeoylshikimate esterase-like [Phoenix dactylifera]|uniref:Caffeoylshikimate esterase-like n=1 Tax=Phoenix dactylifera TaxID=42345 RepID=A0A8B7C9D1_PHODC|nr:caffeoylshikimate esterase-like [Phoenix dactylifera]
MNHPILQANKNCPYGGLTREEFYQKHQLLHQEAFMLNGHNGKIFTQTWRPASPSSELKGVVAMVHGYNSESSWIFQLTAVAIAKLGFLACALDLPGHGYSEGQRGHIPTISLVIDDCIQFFDSVRLAYGRLPAFLYGESLGGAIAMLVYLRQKAKWDGLILNGAMCGVSAKFKPVWPLEKLLPLAALIAPNWRVTVTKPLVDMSYKEKWKRELVRRSPRAQNYEHPPASTALEFLRICEEIGRRCGELELPMLVLHGGEDSVCDSGSAELVYELAGSKDKTLKILPGMWHQLIGEPQETVELGFGIIFSWLKDRAKRASLASFNNY